METVSKMYFSESQVKECVVAISQQMQNEEWQPDVIFGINRGGCVPGIYLSHCVDVCHEVLDVRLRDYQYIGSFRKLYQAVSDEKNILIVDDINDTGKTLSYIKSKIDRYKKVKYCALINKQTSDFKLNYHGHNMSQEENNAWVVFPWENW